MDDDGNPRRFQYGPLPGPVQIVPKAEMYALFMILSWVRTGATVWSDCKFAADGFARGRDHPSNRLCLHAQLWRGIFDRAQSKQIRVRRVLAHSTDEHVRLGLITPTPRKPNDFVDSCAKIGAGVHAADKHERIGQRKLCDKVRRVASFLAKAVILTAAAHRPPVAVRRALRKKETRRGIQSSFSPRCNN